MSPERKPTLRDGQGFGFVARELTGEIKIKPAIARHMYDWKTDVYVVTHADLGDRGSNIKADVQLALPDEFERLIVEHVESKKQPKQKRQDPLLGALKEELHQHGEKIDAELALQRKEKRLVNRVVKWFNNL